MNEPYSSAPAPGAHEGHAYVPGEGPSPEGPTTLAYAPVAPPPSGGVGETYAQALSRAAWSGSRSSSTAGGGLGASGMRSASGAFVFPGTETLNPHEIFRNPGYEAPRPERSRVAGWAITLALLGFIPFLSPVGLALGIASLGETADGSRSGRGKAEAAVSLGAMGTIAWLLILIAYLVNR